MINIQKTASKLTILLWNANGVSQHKNELQNLLYEKKIHIALITETHFTQKTNFNILGFCINTKPTILMVLLIQAPLYLFLLI